MAEQLVLLTREERAAARFQAQLREAGCRTPIHIAPLLRFEWHALPELEPGAGLVITSQAVARYLPAEFVRGHPLYTVGQASADVLAAKGAALRGLAPTAQALSKTIQQWGDEPRLYWLHGSDYAYDFCADLGLREQGIQIRPVPLYRHVSLPLSAHSHKRLSEAEHVIAPLFSAQSARRFCQAWPVNGPRLTIAAISFATLAAILPAPGPAHIAAQPDAQAMIDLTLDLARPKE